MKFRSTTNSIRIRVRKSDLDVLRQEGMIESCVHFGGGHSFCVVLKQGEIAAMHASYADGQIRVEVPALQVQVWMASDEVSLEYTQEIGDSAFLHILIEKDFPCRHTTEQSREDTFYELAPDDPAVC